MHIDKPIYFQMHIMFLGKGKTPEAMARSWDECQMSQEEDDRLATGSNPPHGSSPFHEEGFELEDASLIRGTKRN